MNEVLTLWVVLLLIYFLECLALVPEERFVFRVRWLQHWRPGRSLIGLGRHHSQIYLSNFFPGWGDIAVCASDAGEQARPEENKVEEFRKLLDTKAARRQLRAYRRVLRPLYWDSYLMFAVVVFLFPVIALRLGLWIALSLVPIFLLGVVHMVCAFRRVHRAFTPHAVSERREKTIGLLLSPLGAIRVPALLLRNAAAGFHPLAVAAATMPSADARQVASRILRRLRFAEPSASDALTRSSSEAWQTAVWEWTAKEFGNPELLLGPPVKRYRESLSYCPRCEQEYVLSNGECSDCPEISLQNFPDPTAPAPAHIPPRRARK